MFDVGLMELAVIALVAVIVFGPDKVPDLARQAGRFVRQVKRFADGTRDDLRRELGPEFADLELTDLDPRKAIRKHILEAMDEDDDATPVAPGLRPLAEGELPPYDAEAT
ncbi:sec-independent protein translocase protein TatB [Nocardioides massiliensis]|uniref:Sec-independent protein translocase protein TatB n=2 Tax=Nocardioides massiliensis TaxID=1325935 RepID=A0ABT9NUP0_9ACTN|nr:sec-independent translocase [Nocardioides massiliensis]MDP9824151.1 sec-independent protein translocase protein TatB [Nocardioides massiliensis]